MIVFFCVRIGAQVIGRPGMSFRRNDDPALQIDDLPGAGFIFKVFPAFITSIIGLHSCFFTGGRFSLYERSDVNMRIRMEVRGIRNKVRNGRLYAER